MIPPATAITVTLRMPYPPHTPNKQLVFFFSLSGFQTSLFFHSPAAFPRFSHSLHTFISFPQSHPNNLHQIYPRQPYETPPFAPSLLLPALADCQCLWVSCRHFSFIILSKSGMALARGDWVSVKHQGLIEFVLKWVIEGTLLMQS